MSDPTTVNKTAALIDGILQKIIEGAGEDVIVALILADTANIVAIPVVGVIWKAIVQVVVGKIGAYFYIQAANAMTKVIIDIQVGGEENAANQTFQNLQMAVASGDQHAIDQASKDLDAAYGALIHSDGSYSPVP
jgi:hypothetical protein